MKKPLYTITDVTWVIDQNLVNPNNDIVRTCQRLGVKFEVHDSAVSFKGDAFSTMWRDEGAGPTVAYGSQNFALQFINNIPCIPGSYPGTVNQVQKLKTQAYLSKIDRSLLLNSDFVFVPVGNLKNNTNMFDLFKQTKLFIKDNETFKRFSGEVVAKDNWIQRIGFLQDVHKLNDEDLILIASEKTISNEQRFVIVENKVVAQTPYNGKHEISSLATDLAILMADNNTYLSDMPYTLDIAMFQNQAKIIEINSFTCAGLYDCNLDDVVVTVSEKAIKDYNQYLDDYGGY